MDQLAAMKEVVRIWNSMDNSILLNRWGHTSPISTGGIAVIDSDSPDLESKINNLLDGLVPVAARCHLWYCGSCATLTIWKTRSTARRDE